MALLGSVFLLVLLLAGATPVLAASPITGVAVSPGTAKIQRGQAVYMQATIQGSGDFDRRVVWSLTPANAGSVSRTGLFISDPNFRGIAKVIATSVENPKISGASNIGVGGSGGVWHVDQNYGGSIEKGTATQPYRTIQKAVSKAKNCDTIKVAQGTYPENVDLNWQAGVLLLGGFKGGTAAGYANNRPGDFVTRKRERRPIGKGPSLAPILITNIQSPKSDTAVVKLDTGALTSLTYAVDGFTMTGGFRGFDLHAYGSPVPPITFFISGNQITNNVAVKIDPANEGYDMGGGIKAEAIHLLVLNNQITGNRAEWGGGFYIKTNANTFLIQENLIENNQATHGLGGGGGDFGQLNQGQGTGVFTWNIVRNNQAGGAVPDSCGGGVKLDGGPLELSHNVYASNETKSKGGGVFIPDGVTCVLRHELIYKNNIDKNSNPSGSAGLHAQGNSTVTVEHCTITGNDSSGISGNGIYAENATVTVHNSIVWGNTGNQLSTNPGSIGSLTMSYSDSQGYFGPGDGNISTDPFFADPDHDDYHLKSTTGRWNPATGQWVQDVVHSPCIDAGDPATPYELEPIPNGSRTNMGAYGSTPEASKSK